MSNCLEFESTIIKINSHYACKKCSRCWGSIKTILKDNKANEICCINCGIGFVGEEATQEYDRMRKETVENIINLEVLSRPPKYGEGAFFEKIVTPTSDLITEEELDERIESKLSEEEDRSKITRREFPKGSPGFLFAQAELLMAGLETKPHSIPELFLPNDNTTDSRSILESFDNPDGLVVRNSIGATIIESIISAFSCELAMKAILLSMTDEAPKTHDLWVLYSALPEESKSRLEKDFSEIAETLKMARETFNRERYFEFNIASNYMQKILNPVFSLHLGKSARIIIDEAILLGLEYELDIKTSKKEKVVGERLDTKVKGKINIVGREGPPRNA